MTVVPNTPLTGTFTLTNLSDVTLTGLTATASGGPAGLTVQLTLPGQIAGDGTATLGYSLDDTSTQAASGVVTIQVTTTQGAVLSILLGVSVAPLTPVLAANPGYLDSGMVVGAQTLVSFTVVNNGGSPSGDLQVSSARHVLHVARVPRDDPLAGSRRIIDGHGRADARRPICRWKSTPARSALAARKPGSASPSPSPPSPPPPATFMCWWTTTTRSRKPVRRACRAPR